MVIHDNYSIPKLFRLNFEHGTKPKIPMVKMTNRNFRLAINRILKNGEFTDDVARVLNMSQRR
jgi:hypothetical protein